jgi:hypothetical protein
LHEPDDYDGAWKEALERFLPQFLTLAFPPVAETLDWSQPARFLDTELQEVARDAGFGPVRADQLVEVLQKGGPSVWLLIHLEVQTQRDAALAERMFRYAYRIFDRFGRAPVSLALLADTQPRWKPREYGWVTPVSSLRFRFAICKLRELDLAPWLAAGNPMAQVIEAHRLAQATTGQAGQRRVGKLALVRRLVNAGLSKDDFLACYRLIQWLLALPKPEELNYLQGLNELRKETDMPHISMYDQLILEQGLEQGLRKGKEQGRQEMLRDLIRDHLTQRLGSLPDQLTDRLAQIQAEPELRRLVQAASHARSVESFTRLLGSAD